MATIEVTFPLRIPPATVKSSIEENMLKICNEVCYVRFIGIDGNENSYHITASSAESFYKIGMMSTLLITIKKRHIG